MPFEYCRPRTWVPEPHGEGFVSGGFVSWEAVVTCVAPWTSLLKLVETTCASAESDSLFSIDGVNEMTESSAATIAPTMSGMIATTTMSSISVKPFSSLACARGGESR